MLKRVGVAVAALGTALVVGCTEDVEPLGVDAGTGLDATAPDATPPDTGSMVITGRVGSRLVHEDRVHWAAADLSETRFRVFVTDGSDTREVSEAALSVGEGQFTFAGVPTAERTLVVMSSPLGVVGIESTRTELDFGETVIGRVGATATGVRLRLELGGLSALRAGESRELAVLANQPWWARETGPEPWASDLLAASPEPGLGPAFAAPFLLRPDLAEGDWIRIGERVPESNALQRCRVLDRVFDPGPVAVAPDDRPLQLLGAMTPLPRDRIVRIGWDAPGFRALGPTETGTLTFSVHGVLPGAERGASYLAVGPRVAHCVVEGVPASSEVRVANPFPVEWRSALRYRYAVGLPSRRAGTGVLEGLMEIEEGASLTAPRLGPVEEVDVNGEDASVNRRITEPRLRIRWRAPRLGKPDVYRVSLRYPHSGGSCSLVEAVASEFYTTRSEIVIPVEAVSGGRPLYRLFLSVTAMQGRGLALSESAGASAMSTRELAELEFDP